MQLYICNNNELCIDITRSLYDLMEASNVRNYIPIYFP